MRNLLNPRWILVINILPFILLLWLMAGDYKVIKPLLEEYQIHYWKLFSLSLTGFTLINLVYSSILIWKKRTVHTYYSIIAVVVCVVWMYVYLSKMDTLFPSEIPMWMLTGQSYIYPFTFLMPTFVYFLVVVAVLLTPAPRKQKAWISFLITIAIPVTVYLVFITIMRVYPDFGRRGEFVLLVFAIICTLLFLFFLCRGIYIMVSKKGTKWKRYELLWKIPLTVAFPLIGLAVNDGHIWSLTGAGGVFGDFSSAWFYILAVVNGLYVCLPATQNPLSRSIIFYMRCSTFPYTLYFFLVFLPYLPLSIAAILIFGLGFLMLTPLVLFLIHSHALADDYRFLRSYHTGRKLIITGLVMFLIIPVIVSLTYLNDRKVLHEVLEYVYKPDYSKEYRLDKTAVLRVMKVVESQRKRGEMFFAGGNLPYLTSYYNWVVLDNLTLSDTKIGTIRYLFSGNKPRYVSNMAAWDDIFSGNTDVDITDVAVSTRFDNEQQAWISNLDLEITNSNAWGLSEYATSFYLPDGCWISDYYLYVDDRKEPGILAEKKTAMWIYKQIVSTNLDPGLLHYQDGNRIVFRVFPFTKNEVRKTGIEFMHKEPFTLKLDGYTLRLGDDEQASREYPGAVTVADGAVTYVPARVKTDLPVMERDAYFHFILDGSVSDTDVAEAYIKVVERYMRDYPEFAKDTRITLAGSYVENYKSTADWQNEYRDKLKTPQGFYADRAIKKALIESGNTGKRPLVMILTEDIRKSILDANYSNFRFLTPDCQFMYVVNSEGKVSIHSLMSFTASGSADSLSVFPVPESVRVYTTNDGEISYLRNDTYPDIVLNRPVYDIPFNRENERNWNLALTMQGQWLTQQIYPKTFDDGWHKLLQASFRSRIMTPVTSFIVVENEAQRAALERKQKQVLAGNQSLDTAEDEVLWMSEPAFWILMILAVGLLAIHYRRGRVQTVEK